MIDGPRAAPLRLVLLGLVVLGLAPGFFMNGPAGRRSDVAEVTVTPLASRDGVAGALTLTGAWELASAHHWFGGFSALVAGDGATLIAGTDRGFLLEFDLSGDVPRAVPGSFRFVGESKPGRDETVDLEALARDPATGTLWAAFESDNIVMRMDRDGTRRIAAPSAIANWSQNSGPETMARLADGRFLIIAEEHVDDQRNVHEALLFSGAPDADAKPLTFGFVAPGFFDPVDAAQLPDGRVLILVRVVDYTIPATFNTAIVIADPREIKAGDPWQGRIIQLLSGGVFADNFEGIAYVPSAKDPARGAVWLIADNNFSIFQRNLLLRFEWGTKPAPARDNANEKAPGNPDA